MQVPHTRNANICDPYYLSSNPRRQVSPENGRERIIRQAAYFLAEQRAFAPGHELDDWLLAEKLVAIAFASLPE